MERTNAAECLVGNMEETVTILLDDYENVAKVEAPMSGKKKRRHFEEQLVNCL